MQNTFITRNDLKRAFVITKREIRDSFRDWRIMMPILFLTLFFPALMNFTAKAAVDFVSEYGAEIIGERLIPFLLMIVGFFPITVSIVIALESFVGEKERHSLEPLLSSPLSNIQLYLGKVFASTIPPLAAAYMGIIVYLVGLYINLGWVAPIQLLIQIVVLTTVQATVMVSAAVVISTQVTSVRASNLLSSFVIIPMALLIQGESVIMFWARYDVLWAIIFGLVFLNIVLVRMGVQLFNREELLGKDLDEINVGAMWKFFRKEFVGESRGSIIRWYRYEVTKSLKRLSIPALMMILVLIAGGIIGFYHAALYPLPPALLQDVINASSGLRDRLSNFGFFTTQGVGLVLYQNVRASLIAAALGMFTFGVLSSVVLMLPLSLAAYFAGQAAIAGYNPLLFLAAFILPHGILEIPAIILIGAATINLGASIISPPQGKTLGDGWLIALTNWVKIFLGVAFPLLIGAAILEVFLTPTIVVWALGK